MLYYIILYYIILYYIISYHIISYGYTILGHIIQYYIVLYYVILYYIMHWGARRWWGARPPWIESGELGVHGCHILPFRPILWNRCFPSEPAKQPRTASKVFQRWVEYGKGGVSGQFHWKMGQHITQESWVSIGKWSRRAGCPLESWVSRGRMLHTRSHKSEIPLENTTGNPLDNSREHPLGKWQSLKHTTTSEIPLESATEIHWEMPLKIHDDFWGWFHTVSFHNFKSQHFQIERLKS